MNKILLSLLLILIVASCDPIDEPLPQDTALLPIKMEGIDYKRELVYDNNDRLTGVLITNIYASGTEETSLQSFFYDNDGRLTESTTDTGWRMVYTTDPQRRVVETLEYINGSADWSQLHKYTYNPDGTLQRSITYQDIPEEGGIIPVSKEEYTYDGHGNVIVIELFYYNSRGENAFLLTKFTFSDYDDKVNSEELFNVHPFNPSNSIRKNNPGKMSIQNKNGFEVTRETYAYTYHERGYATEKTTTTTQFNGDTGSYTTKYSFRE